MGVKLCVLEDRACIGCGECERCDLDPGKICDNCEKCLRHPDVNYYEIKIDDIMSGEAGKANTHKTQR